MKKVLLFVLIVIVVGAGIYYVITRPKEGDRRLIYPDCLKKNPNRPERNWCYEVYIKGEWMGVN